MIENHTQCWVLSEENNCPPHRQEVEEMREELQESNLTFNHKVMGVVSNTLTPWRPLQVMVVALRALNMGFWCVGFFRSQFKRGTLWLTG